MAGLNDGGGGGGLVFKAYQEKDDVLLCVLLSYSKHLALMRYMVKLPIYSFHSYLMVKGSLETLCAHDGKTPISMNDQSL